MDFGSGRVAWECADDLARYISNCIVSQSPGGLFDVIKRNPQVLNILELGCGHPKPTIALLHSVVQTGYAGKINVVLQDYDQATIENVTKPSIETFLSNLTPGQRDQINVQFIHSSWEDFETSIQFHAVLSSECIYREDLFPSFSKVMMGNLSNQPALSLVAAKRYYFGCGGGTIGFSDFLAQNYDSLVTADLVHVVENGMSNTREIIAIKKVHS